MTALTGQVADTHDIVSLQTRYLDKDDPEIDDSELEALKLKRGRGVFWHYAYWGTLALLTFYQCNWTYAELNAISEIVDQHKNVISVSIKTDANILYGYVAWFLSLGILCIKFHWRSLLLNLPLALVLLPPFIAQKGNVSFDPAYKHPSHLKLSYKNTLYLRVALQGTLGFLYTLWIFF